MEQIEFKSIVLQIMEIDVRPDNLGSIGIAVKWAGDRGL